jgi:hypothetical protein
VLVELNNVPGILVPLPAEIPVILGLLPPFQLKVVPATLFGAGVKPIVVIGASEQMVGVALVMVTVGIGFTIISMVAGATEIQPASLVAVIVNVTVCGALVIFVKTPEIIPVPDVNPVTPAIIVRDQL